MNNYSNRCRSSERVGLAVQVRDAVVELRQAQHLLLLRTGRGQARRLARAVEAEWPDVLCAIAASDLLVLVTASGQVSYRLRQILGSWMSK